MENLCRKYERVSKEEDASLELNCTTGEWVQVVKPGKKPLTEAQVKHKLKELDFGKDLVCSSASVGNIVDEKLKVRVLKHNKRFERFYKQTKGEDEDSEVDENDDPFSQLEDEGITGPKLPNIDFDNIEDEEEGLEESEIVIPVKFGNSKNSRSKKRNSGKENDKNINGTVVPAKNKKRKSDENSENMEGTVIPVKISHKNDKFGPYSVPVRQSPRSRKPVKYF